MEKKPTLRERINTLRRKIASPIIGEQVALYLPTGRGDLPMADMTDEEIGVIARRWYFMLDEMSYREARDRGIAYDMFTMQGAVVTWAKRMLRMNATTLEVSMSNVSNGDPTLTGNFRVTVEKLPEDYAWGREGIQGEEDADGNLVKYQVNWKAPKAARRTPQPV
jgi:hypothetical protein